MVASLEEAKKMPNCSSRRPSVRIPMSDRVARAGGFGAGSGEEYTCSDRVRLEISRDKLLELLREEHLCASDFRCADCRSKDCVWRLILSACSPVGGDG